MTYRCGLNRAYIVLCGLWLLAAVFVVPWYWKTSLLDAASQPTVFSMTETDPNGSAHRLAAEYIRQNEELTYAAYWRDILLSPLGIGVLIGVPLVVYALLYSVLSVLAWVVRGFAAESN